MPTKTKPPKASTRQKRALNSYYFSIGDSVEGPLWIRARVFARTPAGAAKQLRATLGGKQRVNVHGPNGRPVEYVEIHINAAHVVASDIYEAEAATEAEIALHAPFLP